MIHQECAPCDTLRHWFRESAKIEDQAHDTLFLGGEIAPSEFVEILKSSRRFEYRLSDLIHVAVVIFPFSESIKKRCLLNQNYDIVVDSQSQSDFFVIPIHQSLLQFVQIDLMSSQKRLQVSPYLSAHLFTQHSCILLLTWVVVHCCVGKGWKWTFSYVCVERVHALFELIFIYGAIGTISEFLYIFSLFLVRFSEFRYSIIFCTTY